MTKTKEYRDPETGQYAYWNNFDRVCECGHTLGIHCAGGFDCFACPPGKGPFPVEGLTEHCTCQKFKPQRKRRTPLTRRK